MTKDTILEEAKQYIEAGISLIPVSKSKLPLIQWKEFQERRATLEDISLWADMFPDMQLGAVTGKISNLIVVDVENGGDIDWLPKTAISKTGGDGFHYYYSYVPGMTNKVRIKNLTDIRSDGGYVIIPPSETTKGKYEWVVKTRPIIFPKNLFTSPEIVSAAGVDTDYPGYGSGQRNNEMAKYIGHILAKVHPSEWNNIAYPIIQSANQKNNPPLPEHELRGTFDSIVNLERRSNSDRWYKKEKEEDENKMWSEEDNKIMLIKDIAAMQEYLQGDRYEMRFPIFDAALGGGFEDGDLIIISGISGFGKCHGKGTKIMMHDGSIKNVEDVIVGDKLMGDDSTPRNVLSLATGTENIYQIKDIKGNNLYTVNKSHILSLNMGRDDLQSYDGKFKGKGIIDIPLETYLNSSKSFKRFAYGYRVPIKFRHKEVDVDPYFIGLWLGDGHSEGPRITTADNEIIDYLNSYAKEINLIVTVQEQKNNKSNIYSLSREKKFPGAYQCVRGDKKYINKKIKIGGYGNIISLKEKLRKLNLINNKHIPDIYKFNSIDIRKKVLAGLIDSDGTNAGNCYEITQKSKTLSEDIVWLAKSLGLGTSITEVTKTIKSRGFVGKYYRVGIFGELESIPVLLERKKCTKRMQHKDVLKYGINIEELGLGNYYGFQIDGNHRYVLGDFSVTHNTTMSQQIAVNFAEQGLPVLFLSYEVTVSHLWNKFKEMGVSELTPIYSVQRNTTGNVGWIENKIKEAKQMHQIKLVVIDHLGFLMPKSSLKDISSNYAIYIGQICRDLKQLALREGVIIVMPVHLRKTEDPTLNDLGNSSAIGQESDAVFILHRNRLQGATEGNVYEDSTKIMMVKNRKTGQSVQGHFKLVDGRFKQDEFYIPQTSEKKSRWSQRSFDK